MLRFIKYLTWFTVCWLNLLSYGAWGESFEGQIVGLDCAQHGTLCPLNQFEQHISQESDFVLLTSNKQMYRLVNISRDTLVRHVNKKVIISGTPHADGHSIKVQQLQVHLGHGLSRYESVWQAP